MQQLFDIPDTCVRGIFNHSSGLFGINPEVTDLLNKIQKQWFTFVHEDKKYKKLFSIRHERGWINNQKKHKRSDRNIHDLEECFYFNPRYLKRLQTKGVDYKRYRSFFNNLLKLYTICYIATFELAIRINRRLPGKDILAKVKKAKNDHTIRLLFYPKQRGIPKTSFDTNFLTLALLETFNSLCFGLELEEKYQEEYVYKKNQVLCIVGGKFDHITKGNVEMKGYGVKGSGISIAFLCHIPLHKNIIQDHIKQKK